MTRTSAVYHVLTLFLLVSLAVGCQSTLGGAAPTSEGGAPSAAAGSGQTVKIGVIGSITGPMGGSGIQYRAGALLAAEEINGAGGGFDVAGKKYKLELLVEDDETKPATAVGIATRLMDQYNVRIMLGPFYSASMLAVQPVTEPRGVIHITHASAPQVLSPQIKHTFRAAPDTVGKATATVGAYKETGMKTVAFIQENSATFQASYDAYSSGFEKVGVKVVGREVFDSGNKDFFTILAKLKAKNPDVLFVTASSEGAGLILKQRLEIGWPVQTMGDSAAIQGGKPFYDLAGAGLEGHIDGTVAVDASLIQQYKEGYSLTRDVDKYLAFLKNFKQKYPDLDAGPLSMLGYDHVYLAVEAMKQAGTVDDNDKIVEALHKIDYYGATLRYKFDALGQSAASVGIAIYHEGGANVPVASMFFDPATGETHVVQLGAKLPQISEIRKARGY